MTPSLLDVILAELEKQPDAVEAFAERLAPRVATHVAALLLAAKTQPDGWLDSKGAAAYLGISKAALHRHTAERTIPFEQDGPGCKLFFKRSKLDVWRRGERTPNGNLRAAKSQPNTPNGGLPAACRQLRNR